MKFLVQTKHVHSDVLAYVQCQDKCYNIYLQIEHIHEVVFDTEVQIAK